MLTYPCVISPTRCVLFGFSDWNTLPPTGKFGFQLLNATGSVIKTGADGLHSLDYVISPAGQNGLELIILFVNNWADFGGIDAYAAAFGNETTWFINIAAQAQYRTYRGYCKLLHQLDSYLCMGASQWALLRQGDTSVTDERTTGVSQYIKVARSKPSRNVRG